MIGLTLDVDSLAVRRMGTPPAPIELAQVVPQGWDGTAGSGFASVPNDPLRQTAKPIVRLVTLPRQTILDTHVVGAMAVANDGGTLVGGIDRVRFHFEGSTVDVLQPSFRSFTRRDGSAYLQFAYWAELAKPDGIDGEADLYVEAVPSDATMQSRVIGPYSYYLYEQEYTHQLTLDPAKPIAAGSNYHDLNNALNYLRGQGAARAHILGSGPMYELSDSVSFRTLTGQTVVIEWTEPVVISQSEANKGTWRPNHNGLLFRGSNISFDMQFISSFVAPSGTTGIPYRFDKVRFFNSEGRDQLWDKGKRPDAFLFNLSSNGGVWLTDCEFEGTVNSARSAASLVRGCTFDNVGGDNVSNAMCVANTVTRNIGAGELRTPIDALTVQGPAGATLNLSGVSDATNRTLTAMHNGSSIGTFVVSKSDPSGANFNVSDVVDWLSSLPGWSATLIDDTRRATALAAPGTSGNAFNNLDVSSPTTLSTVFDVHADWYSGDDEKNVLVMNNTCIDGSVQFIHLIGSGLEDVAFLNNGFSGLGAAGSNSNFGSETSHGIFAHNASPDQSWVLRDGIGGSMWSADQYTVLANNVLEDAAYIGGAAEGAETLKNNHYLGDNAGFGDAGSSNGGTREDLFVDADLGDFRPAGELLTNSKSVVFAFSSSSAVAPKPPGVLPSPG